MTKVAVVTSIYGEYEEIKPTLPQKDVEVDWVLVTDHRPLDPKGWDIFHSAQWGKSSRFAAKLPKTEPWEYCSEECDYSIWIDGSFEVISKTFVTSMINLLQEEGVQIAQFKHPVRDCIYQEAEVVKAQRKHAANQPIFEQVEHYWDQGHPEHWGLWSSGVIVRRHTPFIKKMGAAWMEEIREWTTCDQLSQPYVMRNLGIVCGTIRGMYHTGKNPWLKYRASDKHK